MGYLNDMAKEIRNVDNHRWWHDLVTDEPIERNKGELMMLMVTELAEAYEGERKDQMDAHLPHRKAAEVEIADCIIRILDYAGHYNMDLDGAIEEKRKYNAVRADHKKEARLAPNGKKW